MNNNHRADKFSSPLKRIYAFILCGIFVLSVFPINVISSRAASDYDEGGAYSIFMGMDDNGDVSGINTVDGTDDGSFAENPYWKNDTEHTGKLVAGDESDYNLYYDGSILHIKDLVLEVNASEDGNAIFADGNLNIDMEGDSSITCNGSLAVQATGDITFTGGGNLTITSAASSDMPAIMAGGNVTHDGTGVITLAPAGEAEGIWFDGDGEILGDGTWDPEQNYGEDVLSAEIVIEEDGTIYNMFEDAPFDTSEPVFFAYDDENVMFIPCDEEEDWSVAYDYENKTIVLRDLKYSGGTSPLNFYNYYGTITIVLEGDNEIVMSDCDGLETQGSLVFEGDGNLILDNQTDRGGDNPAALFVGLDGDEDNVFVNNCTGTITCKSQGDIDFNLVALHIWNVINSGNVNGKGVCWEVGRFTNLVPYTTTYTEPKREGFEMKGKAYYYDDDDNLMYPNNIFGTLDEEDVWRYVGNYDEDGNPIPSNDFYQNYMVNERGVWLTMDFDDMYAFLVYGTTTEKDALPTPDDIVSVQDSEEAHTFNTDLYCALMVEGTMTVNGDITGELTLMENSLHTDIDYDKDAFAYGRDEEGNIIFTNDSRGAKLVVNGDIGFMSLNKSYKGDATINGKLMGIAYSDDVNVKDYEQCDWTAYGASAKAGQLVAGGNFTPGTIEELEGYQETAVYDEEICYVMTQRELEGEDVVGTTAIVDNTALLIDVSESKLPEDTHPLVQELNEAEEKEAVAKISETGKTMVMDISLIRGNSEEVEPDGTVNLYFDNLEGFTNPVVYHIKEDGTAEKIYTHTSSFDGSLKVPTSSFSVYIIAEAEEETVTPAPVTPTTVTEAPTEVKTPDTTTTTTDNKSPSTGDKTNLPLCFLMMIMSLADAFLLLKLRSRI